jgi:hypothetical protein
MGLDTNEDGVIDCYLYPTQPVDVDTGFALPEDVEVDTGDMSRDSIEIDSCYYSPRAYSVLVTYLLGKHITIQDTITFYSPYFYSDPTEITFELIQRDSIAEVDTL